MCMLVCVHTSKCGMWGGGGWAIPYILYMDCTGVDCPPSPSRPPQRELIYLALNGGWANLASWELFRVIIPPLFSLMEVLAPLHPFVPPGHWVSTARPCRRWAQSSLLSACLLVLEAMLHLTLGNRMQADSVMYRSVLACTKRENRVEIQGRRHILFNLLNHTHAILV